MAEYDNNNQNVDGNNNINSNQMPNQKVPEYSFWAENVPGGSQMNASNQNSSSNTGGGNPTYGYTYSNPQYSNQTNSNGSGPN